LEIKDCGEGSDGLQDGKELEIDYEKEFEQIDNECWE
jgi:hypothetical protein